MKNVGVVPTLWTIFEELQLQTDLLSHVNPIYFFQNELGHDKDCVIDPINVDREFGWSPVESFVTGLRNAIQLYRSPEENFSQAYSCQFRCCIDSYYGQSNTKS